MPEVHLDDTIAALATPPGVGGIGVIRLSGQEAISIAEQMFRKKNSVKEESTRVGAPLVGARDSEKPVDGRVQDPPLRTAPSHTIHYGHVYDREGEVVDQVLLSIFRTPKSYTGEDVIEISGHGGMKVLKSILDLSLSYGARQAEPGEFTRRAFLNGRMDLSQAEAVLDLIRAKTDRSQDLAVKQLQGKLSKEIRDIKEDLMKLYAHLEAYLDFPDEDLEVYQNADFIKKFDRARKRLSALAKTYAKGAIQREGALVVIVGRPNVGKSSLLNTLLDRDRAIVSEVPGTTRDTLEESIDLGGLWVRLVDTAGLEKSSDALTQAGMDRTRQYLENGDLFLWVLDASENLTEEDRRIAKELSGKRVIVVQNKIDKGTDKWQADELSVPLSQLVKASQKTREGIDQLENEIQTAILKDEIAEESILITRLRHKRAIEASLESLKRSEAAMREKASLELVTVDLKQALDALSEFVGEIYSEDLLDVIFGEFCIGK